MNVSLPEDLKEFAEAQTKHGYSTPSEYVRELIREDRKRKAKEKLDALLLKGLNSGDPIAADAKFGLTSSRKPSPSWHPARRNDSTRHPAATGAARSSGTIRLLRRASRRGIG